MEKREFAVRESAQRNKAEERLNGSATQYADLSHHASLTTVDPVVLCCFMPGRVQSCRATSW